MKAVQEVGITIDKERLKRALYDAKAFYEEGYRDGVARNPAVVHAEWIDCRNGNATCSNCRIRSKAVYDYDNEQHYCGHCGAKMDGGEDVER